MPATQSYPPLARIFRLCYSRAMSAGNASGKEYYIEFVQSGRYVKVSAIDPESGAEASIVGDPAAGQERLERLAIQKLEYVLRKNTGK